jgi:hypothetical protein
VNSLDELNSWINPWKFLILKNHKNSCKMIFWVSYSLELVQIVSHVPIVYYKNNHKKLFKICNVSTIFVLKNIEDQALGTFTWFLPISLCNGLFPFVQRKEKEKKKTENLTLFSLCTSKEGFFFFFFLSQKLAIKCKKEI